MTSPHAQVGTDVLPDTDLRLKAFHALLRPQGAEEIVTIEALNGMIDWFQPLEATKVPAPPLCLYLCLYLYLYLYLCPAVYAYLYWCL